MDKIEFKNNREKIIEDFLLNNQSTEEMITKYNLTKEQIISVVRIIERMTRQKNFFDHLYDDIEEEEKITSSFIVPKEISNNLKSDETTDLFKRIEELKRLLTSNPEDISLKNEYDSIRETLALRHKGLVELGVKRFIAVVPTYREDLEMYGYEGLVNAINKYNYKTNGDFISYALLSIIHSIQRYFKNMYGMTWKDYMTRKKITYYKKQSLSKEEIKEKLKLTKLMMNDYEKMIDEEIPASSLYNDIEIDVKPTRKNEMPTSFEDYDVIDQYEDGSTIFYEDNTLYKQEIIELRKELLNAFSTLKYNEEEVLKTYFGLDNGKSHTLEEIGTKYNVTDSRIQQIKARGLRKMRHPSRSKRLRIFYDDTTYENNKYDVFIPISYDELILRKIADLVSIGITREGMLVFTKMNQFTLTINDIDRKVLLLENLCQRAKQSEFSPLDLCANLRKISFADKYYILISAKFADYICKNYDRLTQAIKEYKEKYIENSDENELKKGR